MAKIIKLIYTQEKVGTGKDNDPIRLVHQLWSLNGRLIASRDSYSCNNFYEPELKTRIDKLIVDIDRIARQQVLADLQASCDAEENENMRVILGSIS